jgi:hypothetical protein
MGVLAVVGARKGLLLLTADEHREGWQVEGPLLVMVSGT